MLEGCVGHIIVHGLEHKWTLVFLVVILLHSPKGYWETTVLLDLQMPDLAK